MHTKHPQLGDAISHHVFFFQVKFSQESSDFSWTTGNLPPEIIHFIVTFLFLLPLLFRFMFEIRIFF